MSMIRCRECGNEISTSAKACPQCGARPPRTSLLWWLIGIPVAVLGAAFVSGVSTPEYEHRAREVRRACEEMLPLRRDECERIYQQRIREAQARGER